MNECLVLFLGGRTTIIKKVCMKFIFAFSVSIFLFGCSIEKEDLKEDPGLDKSQKIEVSSEENPELVLNQKIIIAFMINKFLYIACR